MTDIAGRDHWDSEWQRERPPLRLGATRPDRELIRFLERNVATAPGTALIELGAGNSRYLPGLAKRFGYRVTGLDYSRAGVDLALANLRREGIDGEVVVADLFDPPAGFRGQFDVVLTMGVVEHFADTPSVIKACAEYMAPGGSMVTIVPNMHGLPGLATRWLSRELYEKHVPMTPRQLRQSHTAAGLNVTSSGYLLGFDAWVANPGASPSRLKRAAYRPYLALTRLIWFLEDSLAPLPATRTTSPWIIVVATKPH